MAGRYSFEGRQAGYAALWARCSLVQGSRQLAIDVAEGIVRDRARYEEVQQKTGVPWWWLGAIHQREAARSWSRNMHNGQPWNQKTTWVPKGRGPFSSWEEAAIDAMEYMDLDKAHVPEWSIERALFEAERYNGWGYEKRGIMSPYVFAQTSLQERGKYVADGQFSAGTWDSQLGIAATILALMEVSDDVGSDVGGEPVAQEDATEDVPTSPESRNLADYSTQALIDELFRRDHIAEIVQRKD